MQKQSYTGAKRDGNRRWDINNLDRMSIVLPRGHREVIKKAATAAGVSSNIYIKQAVEEYIERDIQQRSAG